MPKGYPNAKPFVGKGDPYRPDVAPSTDQVGSSFSYGDTGGQQAVNVPYAGPSVNPANVGNIASGRDLPGEPVPAGGYALYGKEPVSDKPKMVSMKLLKNYRPYGTFEIVGHTVEAVVRKDAAGREYEVEPETFIADQAMPSAMAGVGFESKIWAGTVLRMTAEEAKHCRSNAIAERTIDD